MVCLTGMSIHIASTGARQADWLIGFSDNYIKHLAYAHTSARRLTMYTMVDRAGRGRGRLVGDRAKALRGTVRIVRI
jgi:hypothetical protein